MNCTVALPGVVSAAALVLMSGPASAGIPFVTDDPDTPDRGHYEINVFLQSTHITGETSGVFPSVEINYGLLEHLEAHLGVPIAFNNVSGRGTNVGLGDIELGLKYRFIDADNFGWRPAVAFAPSVALPTGNYRRDLGTGHARWFLPIWFSEEMERWTAFGGGGYNINPGGGNKNFWYFGLGATYEVKPELILGAEIFRTTPSTVDGQTATGFNVGAMYNVSDIHHVMFSVGRNIKNRDDNLFSILIGYQATF